MSSLSCSRRLISRSIYGGTRIGPTLLPQLGVRHCRAFHVSAAFCGTRSQVLKDVGEGRLRGLCYTPNECQLTNFTVCLGITEVQIIQWYVEEGAHVDEWKPLCQYQSDKAVDDVRV